LRGSITSTGYRNTSPGSDSRRPLAATWLAFVGHCGKLEALRQTWLQPCLNARVALALVAGLALALAFPNPGWAGLAWVAPALMLLAVLGTSPARAFRFCPSDCAFKIVGDTYAFG